MNPTTKTMRHQGRTGDRMKNLPLCSLRAWVSFTVGLVAIVCYVSLSQFHVHRPPTTLDANIAFQNWFRHQGGWMSPKLSLVSSVEFNGNGLVVSGGGTLREGDVLLEIPMDLVLTKDKTIINFSSSVQEAISQIIQDPLDQQDVWIAMDLMLQCAMGSNSIWFPYIQVLPSHVPRLATFSDQELHLLQDDDDMAKYGALQRNLLHQIWIRGVRSALLQQGQYQQEAIDIRKRKACWTELSFHRFVALSSSRAMILENDTKYLSPMAEMINHADRPEAPTGTPTKAFQAYHKLENDKLVVYADRDFQSGDMIVEEYGQLDNSLYITAFGFVPLNNPHHCVLLPLPNSMDGAVCVNREGHMDEAVARNLAGELSNHNDNDDGHCDATTTTASPGEDAALRVRAYVKQVAQRTLAASPTDLADDERLLQNLEETTPQGGEWRGMNRDRARLALQFRIEEKKALQQILNLPGDQH